MVLVTEGMVEIGDPITEEEQLTGRIPLPLCSPLNIESLSQHVSLLLDVFSPSAAQSADSSTTLVNIFIDFRCPPTEDLPYEAHVGCLRVSSYRRTAPASLAIAAVKVFFTVLLPQQQGFFEYVSQCN